MRACIIGLKNLKHMTLVSIYTDYFVNKGIPYDVIYGDSYGIDEIIEADRVYKIPLTITTTNETLRRIIYKIKKLLFLERSKALVRKNKYDLVIIWGEETVVLFSCFCSRTLPYKYTNNIRDLFKNPNNRVKRKLKCAVDNSYLNTVSSDGFIDHLPSGNYMFVHSANFDVIRNIKRSAYNQDKKTINIMCIGTFRNDRYYEEFIKAFDNDSRFLLSFVGLGSERIEKFALSNNYSNVLCIGAFDPKDTAQLVKDADVINCAFGNDNIAELYKIPIRMYYAIYLGVPVISTENTWIDKIAKELNMDITVPGTFRNGEIVSDYVYNRYRGIDRDKMYEKLDGYIQMIDYSHDLLYEKLDSYFGRLNND